MLGGVPDLAVYPSQPTIKKYATLTADSITTKLRSEVRSLIYYFSMITIQILSSVKKFGSLSLSADYGSRYGEYLNLNAHFLIEVDGCIVLRSRLIGMLPVTGDCKNSEQVVFCEININDCLLQVVRHIEEAKLRILGDATIGKVSWMSDGAANMKKVGGSFLTGQIF